MPVVAAATASDPEQDDLGKGDSATDRPPHFLVLGPLSIAAGGTLATLQPSRPATLLATLLLHPNSVVSVEALLRTVWDEEPPTSAKAALHTCVQRLRRLFAKYGVPGGDIEAVPGGYRIAVQADTLDLIRFRELAGRARDESEPEAELATLRGALTLWRGTALANVNSQVLHREEVPALAEERLRVMERIFDLEAALNRSREVLPELLTAARAHPTHERFWEQLIEALYRTGRRAQALSEYRRIKQHLRDELGVDPGAGLQRLELSVLRGEEPAGRGTRGPTPHDAAARPFGPLSEAQVLDRLETAGLLRKRPDGYRMHELLYVLTRDAAVTDHVPPAGPGALPQRKDDVD